MSIHELIEFQVVFTETKLWDNFPDVPTIKRQVSVALLANCSLTDTDVGIFSSPTEIREITVTSAAIDQIRCMWHGHRNVGYRSPPVMPLKVFVIGGGQDGTGRSWVDIEVLPGISSWEVT